MNFLLDTNILIRWLTGDDPVKARATERLFKQAAKGQVILQWSEPAIAETTWVLESAYDLPRSTIMSLLESVLSAPGILVDHPERVAGALALYGSHDIDFADAYLAAQAQEMNLPVLSYDTDFDKLPVQRIEPT